MGCRLRKETCFSRGGTHLTRWRSRDELDGFSLVTAGDCSSSMDLAWQLVDDELFAPWDSVLAASQSAGRGRFRRHWHSPPGNVYASLRLPVLDSAWRGLVPLLLGACVIDVLWNLNLTARIKWPNDILVDYKKVGGILIEERQRVIIAGFGLNVTSAPAISHMREDFAVPAACLADFGTDISPPDLWLRVFHQIRSGFAATKSQLSRKEFLDNLEPRMAYIGDTVSLVTADEAYHPATLLGLEADGGIKVRTSTGEQVLYSGAIFPVTGG